MTPFKIIQLVAVAIALITWVLPQLSIKLKIKISLSLIITFALLSFFTSSHYKNWRYFDENKLKITCMQFPPMFVDENNFYYRYMVFLNNNYPEEIKILNFQMDFQSSLFINKHETLISDVSKSLIRSSIEGNSILSTEVERFDGGKNFALLIDCSLPRAKHMIANRGATVNISYTFFGKVHDHSLYVNPMSVMSIQMPKKEAIVFDHFDVLDSRKIPHTPFFTYHYVKETNESGDWKLEIYCSDEKERFLKIKCENPCGATILESEKRIHNDFDPIRVLVLANGDVEVFSWLGNFRYADIAAHYRRGLELVKKEDYKAGAKEFKIVVDSDQKDFKAWFNYGLASEKAQDNETAIEAYKMAIKANGSYAKAHYALGNVLIKTGYQAGGVDYLKKAIELNPRYALAYFRLGCLQKSQGNLEEASININKAIKYESLADRKDIYKECLDDLKMWKISDDMENYS